MKYFKILFRYIKLLQIKFYYFKSRAYNKKYDIDLSISEINHRFSNKNEQYIYFHHYFWHKLPLEIKDHRKYFKMEQRGFGDDAFHSMWYLILKEKRPLNLLEIGVYRGQVISLWSIICKLFKIKSNINGISPFSNDGDKVSVYIDIEYYKDVINNFNYFSLSQPRLHKGYSTDESMLNVIKSKKWDVIYIDGSHDYEIVNKDFNVCSNSLSDNGIIVLDDSAVKTDYSPPIYASSGHEGPSRVANEINKEKFKEILSVGHNRVFQLIK